MDTSTDESHAAPENEDPSRYPLARHSSDIPQFNDSMLASEEDEEAIAELHGICESAGLFDFEGLFNFDELSLTEAPDRNSGAGFDPGFSDNQVSDGTSKATEDPTPGEAPGLEAATARGDEFKQQSSSSNEGKKEARKHATEPKPADEGKPRGSYICGLCEGLKVIKKDGVDVPHNCPKLHERVEEWKRKHQLQLTDELKEKLREQAKARLRSDKAQRVQPSEPSTAADSPSEQQQTDFASSSSATVDEGTAPEVETKGRGSYRCGRCGMPKKGHTCPYAPKKNENKTALRITENVEPAVSVAQPLDDGTEEDDDDDRKPAAKEEDDIDDGDRKPAAKDNFKSKSTTCDGEPRISIDETPDQDRPNKRRKTNDASPEQETNNDPSTTPIGGESVELVMESSSAIMTNQAEAQDHGTDSIEAQASTVLPDESGTMLQALAGCAHQEESRDSDVLKHGSPKDDKNNDDTEAA